MSHLAEFNPLSVVLPSGELTKCRPVKTIVEDLLLASQFTRSSSVIIGLGGGVIGDLSGTY
jgi:pentafunctional AROM polypeptide